MSTPAHPVTHLACKQAFTVQTVVKPSKNYGLGSSSAIGYLPSIYKALGKDRKWREEREEERRRGGEI